MTPERAGKGIGLLLENDFVKFYSEPKIGRTHKLFTIYFQPDENEDGTPNYLFTPFSVTPDFLGQFVSFVEEHLIDNSEKYFGIDNKPCLHYYLPTSYGSRKPFRVDFFITTESQKVLPAPPESGYEFDYSKTGCPPNFG